MFSSKFYFLNRCFHWARWRRSRRKLPRITTRRWRRSQRRRRPTQLDRRRDERFSSEMLNPIIILLSTSVIAFKKIRDKSAEDLVEFKGIGERESPSLDTYIFQTFLISPIWTSERARINATLAGWEAGFAPSTYNSDFFLEILKILNFQIFIFLKKNEKLWEYWSMPIWLLPLPNELLSAHNWKPLSARFHKKQPCSRNYGTPTFSTTKQQSLPWALSDVSNYGHHFQLCHEDSGSGLSSSTSPPTPNTVPQWGSVSKSDDFGFLKNVFF